MPRDRTRSKVSAFSPQGWSLPHKLERRLEIAIREIEDQGLRAPDSVQFRRSEDVIDWFRHLWYRVELTWHTPSGTITYRLIEEAETCPAEIDHTQIETAVRRLKQRVAKMDATESKSETSPSKAVTIYEGYDFLDGTRSVDFAVFPVGSISLLHATDSGPFRTFRDLKAKHKEIKQVIVHFSRYRLCSLSTPPPIRTRADYKEDDGCVARVIEILEDPEFPDSAESIQVAVYDEVDPKSWAVSPVFPSRLLRLPRLQSLTITGIQFTSLPKEATAIKHLAIYAGDQAVVQ